MDEALKGHGESPGLLRRVLWSCPGQGRLRLVLLAVLTALVVAAYVVFALGGSWGDVRLALPLVYSAHSDAPYTAARCARVRCSRDVDACDIARATDYGGDAAHPPCCVHILRDMLKDLDQIFQKHQVEYLLTFGSALGVARTGRLIPWTADNDIAFREDGDEFKAIFKANGFALVTELIDRLCLTEDWRNGVLTRWPDPFRAIYRDKYPYSDLYLDYIDPDDPDLIIQNYMCRFKPETLYPPRRLSVYDNEFTVSVPRNLTGYLNFVYGPDWRIPDPNRSMFGYYSGPRCHDFEPGYYG